MVEYFSGTGRISGLAAKAGIACASYELLLGSANPNPNENGKKSRRFPKRSCMDFNGECGFSPLESFKKRYFCWIWGSCLKTAFLFQHDVPTPERSAMLSFLRLAVLLLMQAAFGKVVVVLAPPCSTWVAINAGTSRRTIVWQGGDPTLLQNRKSNKLAARTGVSHVHGLMVFILCPLTVNTQKKFQKYLVCGSQCKKDQCL